MWLIRWWTTVRERWVIIALFVVAVSPLWAQTPPPASPPIMYYHKPPETTAPRFVPPSHPSNPTQLVPFVPWQPGQPSVDRNTTTPSSSVPFYPVQVSTQPADQKPKLPPGDPRSFEEKEKEDRTRLVYSPRPEDVFIIPDDTALERRTLELLREEERKAGRDPFAKYPKGLAFPAAMPAGTGLTYRAKTTDYPARQVAYVSGYVVHRRLHFEEKNAERYGWDLGIIQPLISAAYFYKDVLLWPNSLASGVAYGFWDTNMGKCLPGSPTPYYLYPPGLTVTGSVVEGLVITGAAFAIP